MAEGRGARTVVLTVVATVGVSVLAGLGLAWSGAYDVAATSEDPAPLAWLLETIRERSVAVRADDVPRAPPADSALVAHGFEHYSAMCVPCHGAPGIDAGEIGRGMRPAPPDLTETLDLSDDEIFRVVKHGIKLAGMPAFGPTHSDEEIWALVEAVKRLPDLDPEAYRRRVGPTGAEGDTTTGAGHAHGPSTPPHEH